LTWWPALLNWGFSMAIIFLSIDFRSYFQVPSTNNPDDSLRMVSV
jgi:hypothetical protein